MATFSKRHYIVIAYRLSIAYLELLPRTGELNNQWHQAQGVLRAAERIAEYLASDNPLFHREHFLAVVRGERESGSRVPRSGR